MAPILINAAASLAGNVIDSISEHLSKPHGVHKGKGVKGAEQTFDEELAQTQSAAATSTVATAPVTAPLDTQGALMNQLLGTPEVATALAGANPAQPVQVEMTASGTVALRSSGGQVQTLKVSDATRALVEKLYSAHQSTVAPGKNFAVAVLAVDPSHAAASAQWSKLPARAA